MYCTFYLTCIILALIPIEIGPLATSHAAISVKQQDAYKSLSVGCRNTSTTGKLRKMAKDYQKDKSVILLEVVRCKNSYYCS